MKISKLQILKNLKPKIKFRFNLRLQLNKEFMLMNKQKNMMKLKNKKSQPKTRPTKLNSINKKLRKLTILT
jgi:hypothetical protein